MYSVTHTHRASHAFAARARQMCFTHIWLKTQHGVKDKHVVRSFVCPRTKLFHPHTPYAVILRTQIQLLPPPDHEHPLQPSHSATPVGSFGRLAEQSPLTPSPQASWKAECEAKHLESRIADRGGLTKVSRERRGTSQRALKVPPDK